VTLTTDHRTDTDLLQVRGLSVDFASSQGIVRVVEDVGFSIARGETLGLVGESGCGKTVSSLAVVGLLPHNSRPSGQIRFAGRDLLTVSDDELRAVRGDEISMVFQEPMTSLNPAFTIGTQIAMAIQAHRDVGKADAKARAIEMLDRVGIPDAARRIEDYPHAFSGGMRQRAMIAMALACDPTLLIADEPTTALDVTVQAQILDLLRSLQQESGMAMLFVTHDLGVVADICDRVCVMYAGQVVEEASVGPAFARPRHPYSAGLLAAMPQTARPGERLPAIPGTVPRPEAFPQGCRFAPRCPHAVAACSEAPVALSEGVRCIRAADLDLTRVTAATVETAATARTTTAPLLDVQGLYKEFPVLSGLLRRVRGRVRAVDGVDFTIGPGETLGLVGESGSGKSTVARLVLRLIEPTGGTVNVEGHDLARMKGADLRRTRRDMQMVFQDPYSSLDPRATIGASVGEPLDIHAGLARPERDARVRELLGLVGIDEHAMDRMPHEFSGGQRQRIAIARALALRPKLLVCDEPVSSLDLSTRSQVINLLADLQDELGLAYLFIAHDLSVVRHVSHRIAVMYLGRIVESGPADAVYEAPAHPYSAAILSAIPVPDPVRQRSRRRIVLSGEVPSPLNPPSGCSFRTRCPYAMDVCAAEEPAAFTTPAGTTVHCHLHTSGPTLRGASVNSLA
jgi:peptide/nickel transport system ATP-binding protein